MVTPLKWVKAPLVHDLLMQDAITDIFLPVFYGESLKDCCIYWHDLSALPVKFAGLAIPDPAATSKENYEASTLVCSHLLAAFEGVESFSLTDHKSVRAAVIQLNSSQT
jgi:hypothetical protein